MTTHRPLSPFRAPARAGGALAAVALAAGLLSGCTLLEGPAPDAPVRPAPTAPAEPVALVPGGTAEENLPFFQQTLIAFAGGGAPIEGQPVVDALVAAGFDRAAMQVSFDRTRTDLVADNIFVSVRVGESCLLGQLVTGDRSLVAEAAPALGPEKNICIIGTTRPIDW
ncbi:hypothetical protein [Leucobacter sp. CX87]|uniref:DUF6993 domain-containing protein n=1 Tax=unclassified Leucobacter TaxID=2621730 RepID=UPI00333F1CAF